MNKKGQVSTEIGLLIMVAITAIVGVIFFLVIAQEVGSSTSTHAIANESLELVVNGTTQYIDYRAISDVVMWNETQDVEVGAGNFTITNNAINPTTGALAVSILPDASSPYISIWTISGTVQPTTYIADSGGRAVAGLIAIFFALAVAVVVLEPTLKSFVLEKLGR